jgi:hypothetical protein
MKKYILKAFGLAIIIVLFFITVKVNGSMSSLDGNGHLCPHNGKGCIIKFSDGTYETIPGKWSVVNPN